MINYVYEIFILKKLSFFICAVFTALTLNQAHAAFELSDNIEVYRGEANLNVTLARLLPLDSNLALIRISGIDHELNGLVIQHDLSKQGSNRRFTTQLHGRAYNTLVESSGWGGKSMTLYLYGQREGQSLYFDQDASKEVKASKLIKDHAKQIADGRLALVQNFNRELEIKESNDKLITINDSLSKACDKAIEIDVDWKSVSDDMIKEIAVVSYCDNAFDNVKRACSNEENKAWVKESIDKVSCSFSNKLKLKLVDKNLMFQSSIEAPNQSDFVKYNLLNLM